MLLSNCSEPLDTATISPTGPIATGTSCRSHAADPTTGDPTTGDPTNKGKVDSVLRAVDQARANDERCGPPADYVRVCRALFGISAMHPELVPPGDSDRVSDALLWLVNDAATVADGQTAQALNAHAASIHQLRHAVTDQDKARALIEHASAKYWPIVDAHWLDHCD